VTVAVAADDRCIAVNVKGKLVIHLVKQYKVMTHSPVYNKQLTLNACWQEIGRLTVLPGTNRAADRVARACVVPAGCDSQSDRQELHQERAAAILRVSGGASVLSVQRAVSVPLGIATPNAPDIASTIWRTASDPNDLIYYFDSESALRR
jgi:penicillin V acylase-like amidase (Ntn superfamily)